MNLDDVVQKYYPKVLEWVRGDVPECDAEDVAQEVFLSLLKYHARFGVPRSAEAMLNVIEKRRVSDYYRKGYRRQASMASLAKSVADDRARCQESSLELDDLLSRLPKRYRDVIERRLAGLSFAEIAAIEGATYEGVRGTHRRALKYARKIGEKK